MGPESEPRSRSALCRKVRTTATLESAWRHVRASGLKSANEDIQKETRRFDQSAIASLRRMQTSLRRQRFTFEPQKGVAKKRPGKAPRPIVIAPIPNRIVQRAILMIAEEISAVQSVLKIGTSFGGITGPDAAIAAVVERVRAGSTWYIRSDIPNFFTGIPKPMITAFILASSGDKEFTDLFAAAMAVELANADALSREDLYSIFPTGPIGVAQGSALSPLIGNILLSEFDREMNGQGVTCIRYIDDFLILGSSKKQVEAAFRSARRRLAEFGLDAYDPTVRPDKAELGECAKGLDFLGCRIRGESIQPGKKAQSALLKKVAQAYQDGRQAVRAAVAGKMPGMVTPRMSQSHSRVDRVVKGWGESFAFCNDRRPFYELDKTISAEARHFDVEVKALVGARGDLTWRRAVGITPLADIQMKALVDPRAARTALQRADRQPRHP